ncbi:tetratricopeptide repeat protein [Streptomyces cyaneofuscatus]|uniref:tetratricopeptide repeat protein n=1 Tax=Streptomyces cyaneofuscatus TaxID=66883 RepID=UPI0037F7BFBA
MHGEWLTDLRNARDWSQYGQVLRDFRVNYTHPTTELQARGDDVLALTPGLKRVLDVAPSATTFCNHSSPNRATEPDWRYVELLLRIASHNAAQRMEGPDQGDELVAIWAGEHQRLGGSTGTIQITTTHTMSQELSEAFAGLPALPSTTTTPPAQSLDTSSIEPAARRAPPSSNPAVTPVLIGSVPTPASAFQDRTGVRDRIEKARETKTTTVLTQVLSGGGGVGKSQLAAAYARQSLTAGTELVVWVNATETDQIITLYAQAAQRLQVPGAGGPDAESDARAFMTWLATTSRSWLVILDDLTDLDAAEPWWPPPSLTGAGWVLVTTRRREARLSGSGRVVIPIGTYTPDESAAYLYDRLTTEETTHLLDEQAPALAIALGHLPLALSHAAAYMINEDVKCSHYLHLFNDSTARLDDLLPRHADTESYGQQVAAALLLSLDAAQGSEPIGTAIPALRLAALLDPAGHPQTLWTSESFNRHLDTPHTAPPGSAPAPTNASKARAALRLLHRYGLLTDTFRNGPRAVQIHALTARAVLEITPSPELPAAVSTVADALLEAWPQADFESFELSAVLRANTDVLNAHAGDLLWVIHGHEVLYRAGRSFLEAGLYTAAVAHWRRMASDSHRLLGPEHSDTLAAQSNLALSYWRAGRTADAIALQEQVVANTDRLLGTEHPNTLSTRVALAASYGQAGRTEEAIVIEEQVVADRKRLLGPEHPSTLTAQSNLATSYRDVGRTEEAIVIEEQVVVDFARLLGPEHPNTLIARANLAVSYGQVGRTEEAIALQDRAVADFARLLGPEHPNTLAARAYLDAWRAEASAEVCEAE